jgi:hypothetical protein
MALICPHCHRPLAEHSRPCTGITRRHLFFGLFAGLTAAAAIPDVWGERISSQPGMRLQPGDYVWSKCAGLELSLGNAFTMSRLHSSHYRVTADDDQRRYGLMTGDSGMWLVRAPRRPFWLRQS